MVTKRSFINWLNDHHFDFVEVCDDKPTWMGELDQVTVRLKPYFPERKDNLMTIGWFGRKDNKTEVNFRGTMSLWSIDDVMNAVRLLGLKKQK